MSKRRGIVLLAHGSREVRWREPIEAVARRIVELQPATLVQCAYLELSTPDLPAAASALAEAGVGSIDVVPLFLGMGKHLRDDLPGLIEWLRAANPDITVTLRPAIGEAPELIDVVAQIALNR